jgi:hypothetical protein
VMDGGSPGLGTVSLGVLLTNEVSFLPQPINFWGPGSGGDESSE